MFFSSTVMGAIPPCANCATWVKKESAGYGKTMERSKATASVRRSGNAMTRERGEVAAQVSAITQVNGLRSHKVGYRSPTQGFHPDKYERAALVKVASSAAPCHFFSSRYPRELRLEEFEIVGDVVQVSAA
jgi:hypothetical protein